MENNHDNYYYDKKSKKMFDFYQFFKVLGGGPALILIASFIYQIFEK